MQQLLRVRLQTAQLPRLTRFGGGDQRRPEPPVHQRVLPQHQLRPGDVGRHPSSVSKISFPFACPHHEPEPARPRCRPSPTELRVVAEQQPMPLEQALDRAAPRRSLPRHPPPPPPLPPPPHLLPALAGGGGGIRTPGAFALRFSRPSPSTTRPLLRANFSVLPGAITTRVTRTATTLPPPPHNHTPGSLLRMTGSGGAPSTTRKAGWRAAPEIPSDRARGRPCPGWPPIPFPQHDLAVARAALLGDLGQHPFQDAARDDSEARSRSPPGTV